MNGGRRAQISPLESIREPTALSLFPSDVCRHGRDQIGVVGTRAHSLSDNLTARVDSGGVEQLRQSAARNIRPGLQVHPPSLFIKNCVAFVVNAETSRYGHVVNGADNLSRRVDSVGIAEVVARWNATKLVDRIKQNDFRSSALSPGFVQLTIHAFRCRPRDCLDQTATGSRLTFFLEARSKR